MATSFADILRQQQMMQQQQQQAQQGQGQGMAQLGQLGGKQLAAALRGGGTGGAAPAAGGATGGGGFMATAAPVAAAGLAAYHGDKIGNEAGRLGDKMGLEKTGLPDQARAFGNFVKGDFGASWGNLKDSVKSIFSIF